MNKFYSYIVTLLLFTPFVAEAQTRDTFGSLITKITGYLNDILFLMMGVAIVMFTYYVIKYFIKSDANRAEGGLYILYAVIGFFVLLSFWGIVNILQNSFGLKNEENRPSSWYSFTNLFPGGATGGYRSNTPSGFSSPVSGGSSNPYDVNLRLGQ